MIKRGGVSLPSSRMILQHARKNIPAGSEAGAWAVANHAPVQPALSRGLEAWAALSNRLMARNAASQKAQLMFLQQNADSFPQDKLIFLPNKKSDLSAYIGEDARYVMVGGKSQDTLELGLFKKMAEEYREAFPKKKIILFLEDVVGKELKFVSLSAARPEDKKWVEIFTEDHFPVVGVGDPTVKQPGYFVQEQTSRVLSASEVAAGEAARMVHIRQQLLKWREEYPQAVFFVYTSPKAAAYDWRYSLANRFRPEEVFAIQITPRKKSKESLFHRWRNFKDIRPGTLVWDNKTWARMSGFDAQIILP